MVFCDSILPEQTQTGGGVNLREEVIKNNVNTATGVLSDSEVHMNCSSV